MLEVEKLAKNPVNKYRKRLGESGAVVKKIIQTMGDLLKNGGFVSVLWKKSGKIHTKNLLNLACWGESFPDFPQVSITTSDLKNQLR